MRKMIIIICMALLFSSVLQSASRDFFNLKESQITSTVIKQVRISNQRLDRTAPVWNFGSNQVPMPLPRPTDPVFTEDIPWTKNFAPHIQYSGTSQLYMFYNEYTQRFHITPSTDPLTPLALTFTPLRRHWYGTETIILGVGEQVTRDPNRDYATVIVRITVSPADDQIDISNLPIYHDLLEDSSLTLNYTNHDGIALIKTVDDLADSTNYQMFLTQTQQPPYDVPYAQTPLYTGKTATFTPIPDFYGDVIVAVTVVDNNINGYLDSNPEFNTTNIPFIIRVININDAPRMNSWSPALSQNIVQGDSLTFSVNAFDPDDLHLIPPNSTMNFNWRVTGFNYGTPINETITSVGSIDAANIHNIVNSIGYKFSYPGQFQVTLVVSDSLVTLPAKVWNVSVAPTGPEFTLPGGVYTHPVSVGLFSTLYPTLPIYYTTDGTAPNQNSAVFAAGSPIQIGASNNDVYVTVRAIYYTVQYGPSAITRETYHITGTVGDPVFSPSPTPLYYIPQTISFTSSTVGASFYYTTDGTDPSATNGTLYTGPFIIPSEQITTIKVIGVKADWIDSNIVTATYTITGVVLAEAHNDTFTPVPGDYLMQPGERLNVHIQNITMYPVGAVLHYTTDGSTPNTSSPIYTDGMVLTLDGPTTIWLKGFYPDWRPSDDIIAYYNLFGRVIINPYINGTVFNPAPGLYHSPTNITVNNTIPLGATLYYTTDGTDPSDTNGTLYTGFIRVGITGVVKVIAYYPGYNPSNIHTGNYTITGTTPAPIFNPTEGLYPTPQSITITDPASGTEIYYSTDGVDPVSGASNTSLYAAPVTVTWGRTVLKARAYKTDWDPSAVRIGTYYVGVLPPPTFDYPTGTYYNALSVRIFSSLVPDALFYYTLDGSEPVEGVNPYNDVARPVMPLNATTVLKAKAFKTGWNASETATVTYTITGTTANPQFTPAPGMYPSPRRIGIVCTTPGSTIRYTTNGIDPTSSYGDIYADSILVDAGITFKAIAYKSTWAPSAVVTAAYNISGTISAPVFSVPAGFYFNPITLYLSTSTPAALIRYTTDGSTPSQTQGILYDGSLIAVDFSQTLRAVAYLAGGNSSSITSATYTITGTVATPEFSLPAGEYPSAISVSITTSTVGDTIRYTLDGTDPTPTTGTIFDPVNPILITANTAINAIAYQSGWLPSPVASSYYVINGQAENPIFSPIAGYYNTPQTVSITAFPGNATIRYTTDGSAPTTSTGTIYTVPLTVASLTTIKAIAYHPDWVASDVSTAVYTFNTSAPVITPPSGVYASPQLITISALSSDFTIRYTTDGTIPTLVNGLTYSVPFLVSSTTVVQAYAYRAGWNDSPVAIANYVINGIVSEPVFSVATGTYYSDFDVSITAYPADAVIRYTIDGSIPSPTNGMLYTGTPVAININTVLQAIAYKDVWQNSSIAVASYILKATTPVATPGAGTYSEEQIVSLSSVTPGVTIRYTTDGTAPSPTAGTFYAGAITISSNLLVRAIAYKANWDASEIADLDYRFQIATPVFDAPAGHYFTDQLVMITTTTPGADIYFTIDGSTPDQNSNWYHTPIGLGTATTLKAIAYKTNWQPSAIATASYTFQVTAPTFSVPGGAYSTEQSVVLSSVTPGALIRYTTDGSIPTISTGTPYSGAIIVSTATTINAIAYVSSGYYDPSSVATAIYNFRVENPIFTPPAGMHTSAVSVHISSPTLGNTIRYTTDNTIPSETYGTIYSDAAPIDIPAETTVIVRAIAYKTGWFSSEVIDAGYITTGTVTLSGSVFSQPGGVFQTPQTISITGIPYPSDATIHYTTDGTDPLVTSDTYTTPINIPLASSVTIKVRAFKANWAPSTIYEQTYTVTGQVALPLVMFSPPAGTYEFAQFVSLNTNTDPAGASLHYTTDGSDPTETSPLYSSAIAIPQGMITTLKVRGYQLNWLPSAISSAIYQINPPVTFNSPEFSFPSGVYNAPISVTLNTTNPINAQIRYTTDGTDPSETVGTIYTDPISVDVTTTIKAIAYLAGYTNSQIVRADYVINITVPTVATPTFNPPAGVYTSVQTVAISTTTPGAAIHYTTDGTDPTVASALYSAPLSVSTSQTIKAIAILTGHTNSLIASASYAINISIPTVATPTFNPPAGVYASAQTVAITTTTPSATIRYTTDGSEPSATVGNLYTAAINVSSSQTVKAIAYRTGYNNSLVASASYAINFSAPTVAAPTFTPSSGVYTVAQSVTIASTTPGAVIRYTVDGSDPNPITGTVYINPIAVDATTTIKAIATLVGYNNSQISRADYVINITVPTVATPTFTPGAGVYTVAQTVAISTTTASATIRYTTDGSEPSATVGNIYAAAINVNSSQTIKAIAYRTGYNNSLIASASYAINISTPTVAAPTFTPAAGVYTAAQSVTIASTTPGAIIRYTVDGSDPNPITGTVYINPIAVDATTTIKAIATLAGYNNSIVSRADYVINITVPTVATPTFNPPAGVYTSAQTVAISTITAGTTIRYTTDGSEPSATVGNVYTSAINVGSSQTVKAIAYRNGYNSSLVASASYAINFVIPTVMPPTFTPLTGVYTSAQSVALNTTTTGALIRYTTDGTDPSETVGTLYTNPIPVDVTTTIKAVAYLTGYTTSQIAVASYVINITVPTVATPTFTPPAGVYATAQTVAISTTTTGTTIRYTTDGSEPSITVGDVYTSAINVSTSQTIKAITYRTGYNNSLIASASYAINISTPTVAAPTFTPAAGVYTSAQSVTIATTTPGAVIRYTVDGSDPNPITGTVYINPIAVDATTTIKAIATLAGYNNSIVSRADYVINITVPTVATPTFNPPAGVFASAQTVAISTTTAGAAIHYTTDGSDPTVGSALYSAPLSVSTSQTIKAIAILTGYNNSLVASASYAINISTPTVAAPTFTPAAGVYTSAQSVAIASTTPGAVIRYTVDGSDPNPIIGTVYINPIAVDATITIKAIATLVGYNNSLISRADYVINITVPTVATPTFNPPAGVYASAQTVAISTTTASATIRYTTDGSEPSPTVGIVYTTAITVSSSQTIKAIAYRTGYNNSLIASASYAVNIVIPTVMQPTFNPVAGIYTAAQSVALSTTTTGALIHYTTDGTVPSETVGTPYTNPIPVDVNTTIKAVGYLTGYTTSSVATASYMIDITVPTVATPSFTPGAGVYSSAQTVIISTSTPAAVIRYTTDGSEPSETVGSIYATPISVSTSQTIKAIAYKTGFNSSLVASASYAINIVLPTVALPVFTPGAGVYTSAQSVTMSTTTPGALIRYTTDGSNPSETVGTLYATPIAVTSSQTIKAISYRTSWTNSSIASASYVITGQVAAAIFNPTGGIFQTVQNVTLSTPTPGAIIRYTTNGDEPSEASPSFVNPITVPLNTTMTIKAKAYKTDWEPSSTTQQLYNVTGAVASVTFTPDAGSYTAAVNVALASATTGTTIRYTTDGTNPTETSGTIYTGVINVATGLTIKAIAYKANWIASAVSSATYNFNVAAPVFTPLAGAYPVAQTVTLSTVTAGAGIRYTTDGSNPTETTGTLYSAPFIVSQSANVKAIAFKTGWNASAISSAIYVINGSVATCSFNPVAGTYNSNQTVSIASFPPDATIRYTTDNSTPSHTNGTVYSTPIAVNVNTTIKAIAYKTDWLDSGITTAVYNLLTENPALSLASGTYTTAQTLTLTTPTAGALIRYTTNGTNPSETVGTVYSAPIAISTTQTVKAIAYKTGWSNSAIVTGDYVITGQVAAVTFNPLGGTFQTAQSITLTTTTPGALIRYTTNGDDPSEASASYSTPLTVPLNTTMTIKARAYKLGWDASLITQQTYVVTGQVALVQPVFSPVAGIYTTAQTITVSAPIPSDAIVRYTTDGSDPSLTSQQYTVPLQLPLNSTLNLKVKAFKNNWTPSTTYTAIYTTTGQVAMTLPVFNPAQGLFTEPQQVSINELTQPGGATVRYTLDGSDPSETSALYTAPIAINNDEHVVIRARSFFTNWLPSEIYTATYTVTGQIAIPDPVFTPAAGIYDAAQVITLNTDTTPSGAELRYTTDGTEPTLASELYTVAIPLPLDSVTTLKVKAFMTDWIPSATYSATYTITGQIALTGDLFTPAAGIYTTAQSVAITATAYPLAATIRYTTDGTQPTETSPIYTEPISIALNTADFVIKAQAYYPDWIPSQTITSIYTVTGQVILASVPISIPAGIYTTAQTVSVTPPVLPLSATIRYTLDGTEPTPDSPAFLAPVSFALNTVTTLKIKGFAENWIASETISAVYEITGTVATPTFSQPGDIYSDAFSLILLSATAGAEIRYTTDGSEPNGTSALYADGIPIPELAQNLTIKAKAFKLNWVDSQTSEQTYSVLLLPINVRAFTYAGYIRVIWNSPLVSRALDGFNIYRKRFDETTFIKMNASPITTRQEGEYYYDDYAILTNKSYQYYVTAIYDGMESNPSAITTIEYQSQDLTISDASHAYPNPAVTACKIKLVLSRNENVQISVSIFDFAGKKVQTLTVPTTDANLIEIPWNLKNSSGVKMARGTYFARIVASDGIRRVEKVIKIAVK